VEKNGKALSSKHTKHVNIRYFFISYWLHWQGWHIVGLVSDQRHDQRLFVQPPQGALFQKFRDQIMGVVPAQDPGPGKAKWRSMSQILTETSQRKARNSNLVEVRVQYIIWSCLRKKDSTTGLCWENWHAWRMDVQRISHVRVETSSKCNKQVTSK
jgi:hypothetical protein